MAIEVRHGLNPAAAAAASLHGGRGQARGAILRQGLAAQQRAADATVAHERGLERQRLGHDQGLERQQFQFGLQQQAADAAQLRRRGDLQFSLTTRQRAELDQLADAEARALSSTDFTDDEKRELRRRFATRRAGIQPVERPRELTPAEQFQARTYTDPKSGRVFPLDANGIPGRPIYDPPERQPTVQDRVKAVQAATALAQLPDGGIDQGRFQQAMSMILGGSFGGKAAEAEQPQGLPGPAAAPKPQVTKELDDKLAAVRGAKPQIGVLDPSDVNDIQTVRFQIEGARRKVEELSAGIDPADLDPIYLGETVDPSSGGVASVDAQRTPQTRESADRAKRAEVSRKLPRIKRERARLEALRKREAELRRSEEFLAMKKIARMAALRRKVQ